MAHGDLLEVRLCMMPTRCDRTTSEIRDLSPKIISGDFRRSENAQTHTHISIQYPI
jgi:hypothetical protein